MADTHPLDVLFTKGPKKWDAAIVFVVGRSPVGLDTDTDYKLVDGQFIVTDPSAVNPFLPQQIDPSNPPEGFRGATHCTSILNIDSSAIVCVELISFNKLVKAPTKKIITMDQK